MPPELEEELLLEDEVELDDELLELATPEELLELELLLEELDEDDELLELLEDTGVRYVHKYAAISVAQSPTQVVGSIPKLAGGIIFEMYPARPASVSANSPAEG
jgi:hypothetical protein